MRVALLTSLLLVLPPVRAAALTLEVRGIGPEVALAELIRTTHGTPPVVTVVVTSPCPDGPYCARFSLPATGPPAVLTVCLLAGDTRQCAAPWKLTAALSAHGRTLHAWTREASVRLAVTRRGTASGADDLFVLDLAEIFPGQMETGP